jgi:pimeloyl-ACP methyl ester carboxylesterase
MPAPSEHIDQPEPRGQTIAAVLAVGAIYLALPRNVVVGPIWLLPTVIVVLLVPTVVSHRVGKQSLNRLLGFVINGITTLALIVSVILLVRLLPSHRESPLQLLRSGGLLWLTNVIVFALWYWRLDGGGPTLRQKQRKFGSKSFLFPQMQITHDERPEFACARWHPRFVDYLFVAFTQSSTFGPTDAPLLVIQGTADVYAPQVLTDLFVNKACAAGDTVDYRLYIGAGHAVLVLSTNDVAAWFADRVSGMPSTNTCSAP